MLLATTIIPMEAPGIIACLIGDEPMTTATFLDDHASHAAAVSRSPLGRVPKPSLIQLMLGALAKVGEQRAAAELARYVRARGGHARGHLDYDVAQILKLRGLR
jgi:hypothetical protein